jgi:hypothetical protein
MGMSAELKLTSQLVLLLETLSNNAELCKLVRKLGMSPDSHMCQLQGAQHQVPGANCKVPGARCQVPGARC